jgi:hypothetical protein
MPFKWLWLSFCFLFGGDMSLRTKWDWHKVHQLVCKLNLPCEWVRSTNLVPLEEQTISSLTRFGILWTQTLSLINLWLDGSWKSSTKAVRATSKKFLQETNNPKDYALVQLYFQCTNSDEGGLYKWQSLLQLIAQFSAHWRISLKLLSANPRTV